VPRLSASRISARRCGAVTAGSGGEGLGRAILDLSTLARVGARVRDLFAEEASSPERVVAVVDDAYLDDLALAVTGRLGGRAGVAPRLFLKKLVADVLDRVDQFPDFDPRRHYAPTLDEREMTPAERATAAVPSVDDVALEP
jgi:hypothetical protein